MPAKDRLSLPVERVSVLAPKHQEHGTPIGALLPPDVLASLGVDDLTHVLNKHLMRAAVNA